MNVPFLDLKAQYQTIKSELDTAVRDVVENTEFIGGRALKSFEERFARAHGAKHAIGVGNGTDALFVALKTLGVGPGDAVITAANSFIASAEAISMAGARPLFADCNDDYLMDTSTLGRAFDDARQAKLRVRAVMPVHLYGRACDMTALRALCDREGVAVIEDCAQSHLGEHAGRKLGTFGKAAGFSFYPGKNLGAWGDGGLVLTDDDAFAERVRRFTNHGRMEKYDHVFEGINSRLDNLQAAVLGTKLGHLETWTRARIANAQRYTARLAGIPGVIVPRGAEGRSHVYHLFVVRVPNRDRVRARLKELGVNTGIHYPDALPDLPAYAHLGGRGRFSKASAFATEILSLPMFAELTEAQIDHVAQSLRRVVA
jgi:dTDP-4-amino-4,6-dideoxygalactose transaminase